MKRYLIMGLLFVSISGFCYTPEYRYMSDYVVNTGTGEKKKTDNTSYFTCVFSNDMTICYNMSGDKLTKDCYGSWEGRYGYNEKGCYEYKYVKTENGVKIYKKEGTFYRDAKQSKMTWYYAGDGQWKYRGGEWVYSGLGEIIEYIYFSTDYSKMNKQGSSIMWMITYDRIFPDEAGKPTQIW